MAHDEYQHMEGKIAVNRTHLVPQPQTCIESLHRNEKVKHSVVLPRSLVPRILDWKTLRVSVPLSTVNLDSLAPIDTSATVVPAALNARQIPVAVPRDSCEGTRRGSEAKKGTYVGMAGG